MIRINRILAAILSAAMLGIDPASAQHVISIPHPQARWENTVNSAPAYTLITTAPGQYHTSVPIRISLPGIRLVGAGVRATQIIADARMERLIETTSRTVSIRDLVVDAIHMAATAINVDDSTFPNARVLNGVFANFAINDGIKLHRCQMCLICGRVAK